MGLNTVYSRFVQASARLGQRLVFKVRARSVLDSCAVCVRFDTSFCDYLSVFCNEKTAKVQLFRPKLEFSVKLMQ